ncbi:uncharacterized protein [Montipora foliosa]|uniref:uncharacterized protein n=1 Tax=Montipora foliosa TaxID=591990 RepID=UPI0035F15BFE
MKSQREQMMEVLRATKAVNYELISDCDSEQWKGPVSSSVLIRDPEATSNSICCQQCHLNKDALKRNMQAIEILQQGMSALQGEVEKLRKSAVKGQLSVSSPTGSLIRTPTVRPTVSKSPSPTVSLVSLDNDGTESNHDCKIEEAAVQPQGTSSQSLVSIPHHLRSKAAGVNSVKKASRILAVGLFTTQERTSCTISGSTNKSTDDKKRPQFDPQRMTLIHDFLQKTYPKSYQYPEVNRVLGQVAIETRQGRHASDDTVVVSLLKDENCS